MYDVLTSINYIVETKGFIIPDVKNVKNIRKGRQRGAGDIKDTINGVKRVRMLVEDDYG